MSERRDFHKSSYSTSGGNCVEVSEGRDTLVRDTQNRELGHLSFDHREWTSLLSLLASSPR
ncbi:DUF397 domain-containing protein [Nocardiopsis sp. HUAS JQ3]|uniref:DUF397 domain-containing protein n=1 Tax=Nocardiopsis sp. HUAS JQ3 TaxID=3061629 RepID=UPI0023A9986A|nr:DUF397 domain-containing protein [Nocardiopsis sp. HUAS JQ3]WDZ88468.1 DUF397 domain-containing protein [Nocardiopsis sp. HUAS JQ3]